MKNATVGLGGSNSKKVYAMQGVGGGESMVYWAFLVKKLLADQLAACMRKEKAQRVRPGLWWVIILA